MAATLSPRRGKRFGRAGQARRLPLRPVAAGLSRQPPVYGRPNGFPGGDRRPGEVNSPLRPRRPARDAGMGTMPMPRWARRSPTADVVAPPLPSAGSELAPFATLRPSSERSEGAGSGCAGKKRTGTSARATGPPASAGPTPGRPRGPAPSRCSELVLNEMKRVPLRFLRLRR